MIINPDEVMSKQQYLDSGKRCEKVLVPTYPTPYVANNKCKDEQGNIWFIQEGNTEGLKTQ